jgi:hypothetical protein
MMDSSQEDVLEGIQTENRTVTLDLDFLFNVFLRDGSEYNLKVIQGIPVGAKALVAGIVNDALVVIFDTDVPPEVLFESRSKKVEIQNKDLN